LKLNQVPKQVISAGDVGYLISGIKEAKEVKVGDTLTDAKTPTTNIIKGFEDVKPMVLRNLPVDTEDYEELKPMEKTTIERCFMFYQKVQQH
jgi:GTP-binding protein LepA